jgi:hypothetical protein
MTNIKDGAGARIVYLALALSPRHFNIKMNLWHETMKLPFLNWLFPSGSDYNG